MEKQLNSSMIYEGPIFSLTHDEIKLEDGKTTFRDVIHHHGGAGILAIRDNQVLLVSQYRYAAKTQLWEIPAGKLEKDEDPKDCVIRELNEEAGYICDKVTFIASFFTTPGFCEEKIHVFMGNHPHEVSERRAMDDDENITSQWFSLAQAYQMILDGTIIDAKTIIALQHAMLMQKDKI